MPRPRLAVPGYLLPLLPAVVSLASAPAQSATASAPRDEAAEAQPAPIELTPIEPVPAAADFPSLRLVETTAEGIVLTLVVGDPRALALDLFDQPEGPGSLWADAAALGRNRPALLAVINGGFFDRCGEPLGLRRDEGRTIAALAPPGRLYFGVIGDDGTTIRVETLAEWNARPSRDLEAVQTGPRLVWDGVAIEGFAAARPARRSFAGLTSTGEFVLGQASACSLGDLARALAGLGGREADPSQSSPPRLARVLNLDGGRSCDLWLSPALGSDPSRGQRAPWANPVRDFLALKPRN